MDNNFFVDGRCYELVNVAIGKIKSFVKKKPIYDAQFSQCGISSSRILGIKHLLTVTPIVLLFVDVIVGYNARLNAKLHALSSVFKF